MSSSKSSSMKGSPVGTSRTGRKELVEQERICVLSTANCCLYLLADVKHYNSKL